MTTIHEFLRPTVAIDGRRLADRLSVGGLAALAKFTIKWGADDWYSQVPPAELTLDILDARGDFLNLAGGAGIPITIHRGDVIMGPASYLVFEGTIDNTVSTLTRINDPATGDARDVWRVTIKASDPLGGLEQDRKHGQKWPEREMTAKRLHWGPCTMQERRDSLATRSPVLIDWQESNLDQYDNEPVLLMWPVAAYETQQNISALTVLRQTARISQVMNRPYFDPAARKIRFIAPPAPSGLRISAGATAKLQTTPATGTELLPASDFSAAGGISISSTAVEQVTRVELTRRYEQRNLDQDPSFYSMAEQSEEVNAITAAAGTTTWAVATDHSAAFDYFTDWADLARSHIASTYGRQTQEPLAWKPNDDNFYFAMSHASKFLNPSPPVDNASGVPIAYQLLGSLSSWAPGTGPFSIVGGEISYSERGWAVLMNPATTRRIDTPYTLGNITNTNRLDSFEAAAILADFTKLTSN